MMFLLSGPNAAFSCAADPRGANICFKPVIVDDRASSALDVQVETNHDAILCNKPFVLFYCRVLL